MTTKNARSLILLAAAAGLCMSTASHGQAITPPDVIALSGIWSYPTPYEQVLSGTFNVSKFRLVAVAEPASGGAYQDDMLMELIAPGGATLLIGGDWGTPYPGSVRWTDLGATGTTPPSGAGAGLVDADYFFEFGAVAGTWRVNFRNHWTSGQIEWNNIRIIPCGGSSPCIDPGACCLPTGLCAVTSPEACAAVGGVFEGPNTACGSCPPPPGVYVEIGDAGDLPGTAAVVEGSGALNAILGEASFGMDIDMYKIEICDYQNFSASTVGITTWDTSLSLFNDQGFGVSFNDDAGGSLQSTVTSLFLPGNGIYYLAISRYPMHATSAGGRIWEAAPFGTERAPDGPGAFQEISAWGGTTASSAGSYLITFTGACFIQSGPSCYPNCDGSTVEPILNIDDFTCFINEFASAQFLPHEQQVTAYANCDGSTTAPVLNIDDFTCFINEFAAGCR